ncbi:hypothetical protein [Bailinhaonella thermotolerans]|nr:hypothetical protein [Bailinhaonella thermotolerans]
MSKKSTPLAQATGWAVRDGGRRPAGGLGQVGVAGSAIVAERGYRR